MSLTDSIEQPDVGFFNGGQKFQFWETWAWSHHPAWYKEVTGRVPQQALEEARRNQVRTGTPGPGSPTPGGSAGTRPPRRIW